MKVIYTYPLTMLYHCRYWMQILKIRFVDRTKLDNHILHFQSLVEKHNILIQKYDSEIKLSSRVYFL